MIFVACSCQTKQFQLEAPLPKAHGLAMTFQARGQGFLHMPLKTVNHPDSRRVPRKGLAPSYLWQELHGKPAFESILSSVAVSLGDKLNRMPASSSRVCICFSGQRSCSSPRYMSARRTSSLCWMMVGMAAPFCKL